MREMKTVTNVTTEYPTIGFIGSKQKSDLEIFYLRPEDVVSVVRNKVEDRFIKVHRLYDTLDLNPIKTGCAYPVRLLWRSRCQRRQSLRRLGAVCSFQARTPDLSCCIDLAAINSRWGAEL
jgi:hypothetical protein